MASLKHVQNHYLHPHPMHDQWRHVPLTFQPPFETVQQKQIPMSVNQQTPCQATPCQSGIPGAFGPFQDNRSVPRGFRWTADCQLVFGNCPQ